MLTVLPVSCKQSAPAKKSSGNANPGEKTPLDDTPSKDDEGEQDDLETDTDPCKNKKTEDHDEEEDDEEFELRSGGSKKKSVKKKKTVNKSVASLSLLATANYDDDIQSIFIDKCVTCHTESDKTPFETYAKAKKVKGKILEQVESGDMPPSGSTKLTSSEKKKIKEWVDNGAPESGDWDEEEDEIEEDEDSSTSDCDDDNDNDDTTSTGDWDELLKTKEVEKCKDKGYIFDRLEEKCHKAKTASYSCDRSGVVAKFKEININVATNYDDYIKDGYKLDQCGEYNKEPVVFFYKKTEEGEELKLMLKKLCKIGSNAC